MFITVRFAITKQWGEKVSVGGWIDKGTVVCMHNGIFFSFYRERDPAIDNELGGYYAEWNKPDTKRRIYYLTCMPITKTKESNTWEQRVDQHLPVLRHGRWEWERSVMLVDGHKLPAVWWMNPGESSMLHIAVAEKKNASLKYRLRIDLVCLSHIKITGWGARCVN